MSEPLDILYFLFMLYISSFPLPAAGFKPMTLAARVEWSTTVLPPLATVPVNI